MLNNFFVTNPKERTHIQQPQNPNDKSQIKEGVDEAGHDGSAESGEIGDETTPQP